MASDTEVAFITGGGGTIGYGIAKACLDRGWRVVLADVSEAGMAAVVGKLGGPSDRLMAVNLDVRDPDAWQEAAELVAGTLGEVTHLFNNAGVMSGNALIAGGNIETLSVEEWRWTTSINIDGVFFGLKTFVPRFKKTSRPTHINITASMGGIVALKAPIPISYSASKAAVAHMAAQLRTELANQNITSIGISVHYPGFVQSDILNTSLRMMTDADLDNAEGAEGVPDGPGADEELLGRYLLLAIDREIFHIFPDVEWQDVVRAYRSELDTSFDGKADPLYDDPTIPMVDLAHVSVLEG